MTLIHFVSHAKLNNSLTNQQHRIRDFEKKNVVITHTCPLGKHRWAPYHKKIYILSFNTYRVYSQIFSHFLYHLF